ncbi:hypothetical protein [Pseudobdellovibrio sp. HCB154]|uniref:hypothetical protein n=1 Tax=Pseudobdellovibrio sp. HCB154 TaxID=3386277 RepID=UPI0039171724
MSNGDNDKKDPKITDAIKKILTAGSPTDISKELLTTVVGQVLKTKDDITLKATNEMISLIQKIDFVKEFSKFAENHKFKVTAEIEIMKKDDSKT